MENIYHRIKYKHILIIHHKIIMELLVLSLIKIIQKLFQEDKIL